MTTPVRLLILPLQAHSVTVSGTTNNPCRPESTFTPLHYHIVSSTTRSNYRHVYLPNMVIQFILPREWSDTTVATGYCAPEHVARIWWCMGPVVVPHKLLPTTKGTSIALRLATNEHEPPGSRHVSNDAVRVGAWWVRAMRHEGPTMREMGR